MVPLSINLNTHNSRDRARDISEDIRNGRIDAKVNETLPHCRCFSLSVSVSVSLRLL